MSEQHFIYIYMNIFQVLLSSISGFLVMVGYLDRNWLFCSSRSLIESLKEVTPFCVITGIFVSSSEHIDFWVFVVVSICYRAIVCVCVCLIGSVQSNPSQRVSRKVCIVLQCMTVCSYCPSYQLHIIHELVTCLK